METGGEPPVIDVQHLYFSYEVAQNINSKVIKRIGESDPSAEAQADHASDGRTNTRDGGLSLDLPRRQHNSNEEIVYKVQLRDVTMHLPRGSRCLLVGSNGSGKSTLLNILGGRHMISQGDVCVLSRQAFADTTLTNDLALLTGNWTRTVAFVGHGVPYQAMAVDTLIATHAQGVDAARLQQLLELLGVERSWNLTAASDGQRRRVQILLKLLRPFKVLLLDEITTDLDLLVRQELLRWLREESNRGVTIVYCTHIFDGLDGWATHVVHLEQTRLRLAVSADDVPELRGAAVPRVATRGAASAGRLFTTVQEWLLQSRPQARTLVGMQTDKPGTRAAGGHAPVPSVDAAPAIDVCDLRWGYPIAMGAGAAPRPALDRVAVRIARGERVLLTGANGAGKTTLLRIMGGKHLVTSGRVLVLGHDAFADVTALNTRMVLLTGDWSRTVATVGSGVPYQADFSAAFMATNVVNSLKAEGTYDTAALDARLTRLQEALDIDGTWRMNAVSDGQRRRIQILLKLLRPADVMLMDEVTTDLDVLARQSLLHFLREECEQRGVTVVYATHILDGLDAWPTKVLHVSHGTVAHYGDPRELVCTHAPGVEAPPAGESGALYRTIHAKLLAELHDNKAAAARMAVQVQVAAAPAAHNAEVAEHAKTSLHTSLFTGAPGSRFDRFGSPQFNMCG